VLGVIEGYGRVLLGEKGFRSQKARITALAPAFSVQAEVTRPGNFNRGYDFYDYDFYNDRLVSTDPEDRAEYEEVARKAQQHADAWMAVIQDRLGLLYPDARVFATTTGLLASVKTRGKP
jgi:hypothetical protein